MADQLDLRRLRELAATYRRLRIAVVGDFCLDRYLEIDPARAGKSIETGLTVHNVVRVRSQPGGAGTILNNLSALGVGEIFPVGFAGEDGEGFELQRALAGVSGVKMNFFFATPARRTFTYTKPLIVSPRRAPRELNRLDFLNWSPTPPAARKRLDASVRELANQVDAIVLLDQVDLPETGVVTSSMLRTVATIQRKHPNLFIIADSRRNLAKFPPVHFKMNRAELSRLSGVARLLPIRAAAKAACALARKKGNRCFVTLAENGILAATPDEHVDRVLAFPTRGEIDVVGAGDCVTANLTAALASGATTIEALRLANAAASVVVHILGTTGTATIPEIAATLKFSMG